MKKSLYARKLTLATALISVVELGVACDSDNDFTGFHIGAGINASFDKYDVHVTSKRASDIRIKTVKVAKAANNVEKIEDQKANSLIGGLWQVAENGDYRGQNNLKIDSTVVVSNGQDDYNAIANPTRDGTQPLSLYTDAPQNDYAQYDNNTGKTVTANKYKGDVFINDAADSTKDFAQLWYNSTDQNIAKVGGKYYAAMSFYTGDSAENANAAARIYSTANNNADGTLLTLYHEGAPNAEKTQFNIEQGYQLKADDYAGDVYNGKTKIPNFENLYYKSTPDETRIGAAAYNKMTFYTKTNAVDASQVTVATGNATCFMPQALGGRRTGFGGELKLAYFGHLDDKLIVGIDLTGTFSSKMKKALNVSKFEVKTTNTPELELSGAKDRRIATSANDGTNSKAIKDANIEANEELTVSNRYGYENVNPGITMIANPTDEQNQGIDVSEKSKEVIFEKGAFNPKLAVVAGIAFGSWFAGVRTGVSHVTGNIKTSDMVDSKKISITSPFIGIQVMKQLTYNLNMYMTADLNVGEGSKNINEYGINNFKRQGYNVSAGLTWRIKP